MPSKKQCELARVITKDSAIDAKINAEYSSMSEPDKSAAIKEINKLSEQYHIPFDKGIGIVQKDFASIASKYGISPSTLFCIYMDSKQK